MKKYTYYFTLALVAMLLASCGGQPPLMLYDTKEAPKKAKFSEKSDRSISSSMPLDISPDLLGRVEVPMPDEIAIKSKQPAHIANKVEIMDVNVADKSVSLDTRAYKASAALLFSAVVDGMTALNLPVQDVDSPSGILGTDWIRIDAGQANAAVSASSGRVTRYRYVARVVRTNNGRHAQLEVQTHGQAFINRQWVDRAIQRKVSNELFDAVEDQLARSMRFNAKQADAVPAEQ